MLLKKSSTYKVNPVARLMISSAFFLLLVFSNSVSAQHADIRILDKINNSDVSSGTYRGFKFITDAAAPISVALPVGLLTAGFIEGNRDMRLKAAYMLESIMISEGITYVLKYTVNRPRPFVTFPYIIQKSAGESPSFPSGHTSFAFGMATSLSIAYPKWYVIAPSALFASAVGYSRMYLGVHYPSDVLAGALVGSGSAFLTYRVNKWLHQSKHKSLSVSWN